MARPPALPTVKNPRPTVINPLREPTLTAKELRTTHKLNFSRDSHGDWRWRAKAPNGRIVCDSGQGYDRLIDAGTMPALVFGITDLQHRLAGSLSDWISGATPVKRSPVVLLATTGIRWHVTVTVR